MKYFLLSFLFLISLGVKAQTAQEALVDKMRPYIYQAEKQIILQLHSLMNHKYQLEDLSIQTSITVNPETISRYIGLYTDATNMPLPGLDTPYRQIHKEIANYQPSLHDVFYGIQALHIVINTSSELDEVEKNNIKDSIQNEFTSLKIGHIDVIFTNIIPKKVQQNTPLVDLNAEKVVLKEEFSPTDLLDPKQFLWPSVIFVIVLFVLSILFYLIRTLKFGLKRLENVTSKLSESFSSIELQMPSDFNATERQTQRFTGQESASNLSLSYEEVLQKLKIFLKENTKLDDTFLKDFMLMASLPQIFVLGEALEGERKDSLKQNLSSEKEEMYSHFLAQLARGEYGDDQLKTTAQELLREVALYLHDPILYQEQRLRKKISELDISDLTSLIEDIEAQEFSMLIQLAPPVSLSLILGKTPSILERFGKLPHIDLRSADLTSLRDKVITLSQHHEKYQTTSVDISSYLPFGLGDDNSWTQLSEVQRQNFIHYAIELPVNDLSSLMATLPPEAHETIFNSLPELKSEQLRRKEFVFDEKSILLKHSFLKKFSFSYSL